MPAEAGPTSSRGRSRDHRVEVVDREIVTIDGRVLHLVDCEDVDLLAAEPWRRDAAVAAFEGLLRGLTSELLLLVMVRRLDPAAIEPAGADSAATAMSRHWHRRLAAEATYQRRVLVGIRGPAGQAPARDLARMEECLAAAGIPARRLNGAELGAHVAELVAAAGLIQWSAAAGQARFGSLLSRAMVLDRLPGNSIGPGWLAPLVHCEAECDISVQFAPELSHRAVGLLSRRMRDLGAHRLYESDRGVVPDAAVEAGLEAARQLRDRIAGNAGRPLRLWISAVARGRDEAALDDGWARLKGAFAATMSQARPAHFEHADQSLAGWGLGPLCRAGKLVDSQAAASCIPWLQANIDDPGGYRLGRMSDSGVPVAIAPFAQQRHANANIGVFAASGQGKSFLIGGLLIEARRQGVEAIVVDPEGEYRRLVEGLGGTWLDLAEEASINPFDIGEGDAGAASCVVDVCALLCGGITDLERAAVELAAREAQARAACDGGVPLLRDCLVPLSRSAPRVATVVERFITGALAGFLDRPTAAAWREPLLAVGHRELREEVVPVTTLLLGRHLWQLVRTRPRRRHIVLDEVGMLTAHPPLRQLLAVLARRCRKYDCSLVVATQNIQDLLRSEDGSVVASNCALVFCGGHHAVEAIAMERAFGLTEAQRRLVERAQRGEFVLLAGGRRGAMRVDLPDIYAQLIRGDAVVPKF